MFLAQQSGMSAVFREVGRQVGTRNSLGALQESSHVAARGVEATSVIWGMYVELRVIR